MLKSFFIIVIIIASLFEYIGDSNLKFFARTNNQKYLLYGVIGYVLVVLTLIYILKYSTVMYVNIYWDAVSFVIETVLAYILLKEQLDNKYQFSGFLLILIGILLLNVGRIPV
jgi:multidrug transporter EmrE-like cation transporter